MYQLKADKIKEKGSQCDPENVADKGETPEELMMSLRWSKLVTP